MAIFTPVSFNEAESYIKKYDIGSLEKLIPIMAGVENTNYKLQTSKNTFILTLFEKRTPSDALPFVFKVLQHLTAKKLPVAQPVQQKNDEYLSELNSRPAAIVSFLNGASIEQPSSAHCEAVGICLARLHLASEGFMGERENPFGLNQFEKFYNEISGNVEEIEKGLDGLILTEIKWLKSQPRLNLPTGIIHADLFPDNVLFTTCKNDQLPQISGLIDFYYTATDSFAYDLAITLNCWAGDDNGALNIDKFRALIKGYESKRKLLDVEKLAMNNMFRIASMRFLLSRANDWFLSDKTVNVAKKCPLEYVRKLKFHQQQKGYEGFGV